MAPQALNQAIQVQILVHPFIVTLLTLAVFIHSMGKSSDHGAHVPIPSLSQGVLHAYCMQRLSCRWDHSSEQDRKCAVHMTKGLR